jgi:hypothetical protein
MWVRARCLARSVDAELSLSPDCLQSLHSAGAMVERFRRAHAHAALATFTHAPKARTPTHADGGVVSSGVNFAEKQLEVR